MKRENRPGAAGFLLVSGGVVLQLLLEVTLGRVFAAPNAIVLILTYLSINYGDVWSIEGAFWSGASLDLLLHQPLGCSSLALLLGLTAGRLMLAAVPGENRLTLVLSGALAGFVCDSVFMLSASRPLFSNTGAVFPELLPRLLLTLTAGMLFMLAASAVSNLRARREA